MGRYCTTGYPLSCSQPWGKVQNSFCYMYRIPFDEYIQMYVYFFIQTMLRIWDTFLYEGSKVLFRYAIAIFKYNEEGLMATENSISIFNRLRTIAQDAVDVTRLTHVSGYCHAHGSFSLLRWMIVPFFWFSLSWSFLPSILSFSSCFLHCFPTFTLSPTHLPFPLLLSDCLS